jgi:hypothetical protein
MVRFIGLKMLRSKTKERGSFLYASRHTVTWPSSFVVIPIVGNQHVILSFREIKGPGFPGFSHLSETIMK